MADIFDEVSEELKQDQLIKTWKKYSKLIITLLVIVVLSIISYQLYLKWDNDRMNAISEDYLKALQHLENQNFSDSKEFFLKNIHKQENGYKMLSLFGLAEANFKDGNINEMISNYKAIYENENNNEYYRHLSRILSVIKDNRSSFNEQKMILDPILNSPSKLQLLAAELELILLIKFNKINEAKETLKSLLKRNDMSIEQKSRLELIKQIYSSHAQ